MEDNLIMVGYFKNGTDSRAWWIVRVYSDFKFDYHLSCTQPNLDSEIPRLKYDFDDLDTVVKVGEIRDFIAGLIGRTE